MRCGVTLAIGVCQIRVYFAELGQQPRIFCTVARKMQKLEITRKACTGGALRAC